MQPFLTKCPHCQTSFKITEAQLEAAEGIVRCGSCLGVFSAFANSITLKDNAYVESHESDLDSSPDISEVEDLYEESESDDFSEGVEIHSAEESIIENDEESTEEPDEDIPDYFLDELEDDLLDNDHETTDETVITESLEELDEIITEELIDESDEIISEELSEQEVENTIEDFIDPIDDDTNEASINPTDDDTSEDFIGHTDDDISEQPDNQEGPATDFEINYSVSLNYSNDSQEQATTEADDSVSVEQSEAEESSTQGAVDEELSQELTNTDHPSEIPYEEDGFEESTIEETTIEEPVSEEPGFEEPDFEESSSSSTSASNDDYYNLEDAYTNDHSNSQEPSEEFGPQHIGFEEEVYFKEEDENEDEQYDHTQQKLSEEKLKLQSHLQTLEDDDSLESLSVDEISGIDVEPIEIVSSESAYKSRLQTAALIIGSISLVLLLLFQYTLANLEPLSQKTSLSGIMGYVCNWANCPEIQQSDISSLYTQELLVRSHPITSNALEVSFIFRNDAAFEQLLPLIELNFSDINNRLLANRLFNPDEYLPPELTLFTHMPANSSLQITLDLLDPGPDAVNYALAFRAP